MLNFTSAALSAGLPSFTEDAVPATPSYTEEASWLVRPDTPGLQPVDVFWVYPTILDDNVHWLMEITDPALKADAAESLRCQASVFDGQTNIYAPLYRQMNLAALRLPREQQDAIMQYGMNDVWAAFTHYLEHENDGRPFILAGHSQGSDILTQLMLRHWGRTGAEDRLVAAYLIGWAVTKDDLLANNALSICDSADQTGCIISYNTMAEGRQHAAPTLLPNAIAVNPLTWKTNDSSAPASLNLGARFFNPDGTSTLIEHFTSARIVDGGLIVEPKYLSVMPSGGSFPNGVYHAYDYSLFYENLRQNAGERIRAFLNK